MSRMFTVLRIKWRIKSYNFQDFVCMDGITAKYCEPIVAMMIAGGLAEIPAKVNLGDASDSEFFKIWQKN